MKALSLLLILGIMFVSLGLSCSNKGNNNSNQPSNTNSVSISNFSFSPSQISIKKGTEVTWTNNDSVTHTVTFDTFQSGDLASGSTFKHTFSSTGIFNYHCSIHPNMKGEVQVQ